MPFDSHPQASYQLTTACRIRLLCKFQRNEVAADHANNRDTGVFPLYPEYDWGTVAAWAWAHGVVIDALDRLKLADMKRIVVTGHSRGGKTALCAGIYDERVAITAPNSSGTGGTSSMRYFEQGQKPQRLILHKKPFPHWWVSRFFDFGGKEDRLPFDAHTAKALIAPRALINTHARQDCRAIMGTARPMQFLAGRSPFSPGCRPLPSTSSAHRCFGRTIRSPVPCC